MSLITAQLPVRLTPLVGRESELNEIVRAVTRARLLTLTGPGGTGKTRLALAAARSARESFPAGVCWVELAQIEDPGIVGQTLASRLGVPDTPGQDPAEAVAEYVGDHQVLVVLDNCEHLAGATASLTENLLAACPALTVLATSREALGVEGELNWQVPPLSLPKAGPGSGLTAARMRILSSAQLAERLDDIFALLIGGARSAPPRHQALRATLDWSHDMLDAEERVTFRRLAIFAGGFTLEAAERAAAGGDLKPASMLELLTRLADKSLVRVEHARGDSRYHLLVTIRDYARERLAEAGEDDVMRQAHLAYFTELAEAAAGRIEGDEAGGNGLELELDRLDTELPNLRRAFESATESGDAGAALRIAGPLDRYAYLRGRYHEIRQWMDVAVTSYPDAPAGLRAKALLGSGRLALLQCDFARAIREASTALAMFRELGDAEGAAWSLISLGTVARYQGEVERAAALLAESRALSEGIGFREGIAWCCEQLGLLAAVDGNPAAITLLRRSLELHGDLRDRWRMSSVLEDLAAIALVLGRTPAAARLLGAAEALRETIGTVIAPCERPQHVQTAAGVRAALDEEAFAAARQQGLLATMDELTADLPAAEDAGPTPAEPIQDRSEQIREEQFRRQPDAASAHAGDGHAADEHAGAEHAGAGHAGAGHAGAEHAEDGHAGDGHAGDGHATAEPGAARARAGARARATQAAARSAAGGPLRVRTLGGAVVEFGDTALTAADWGYAKPRELMFLAAPAFASVQASGTQSLSGYHFRTLNNDRDVTFNQLLGINNEGVIAGYFGSGAQGHPNQGYRLYRPYGQGNYAHENVPGSRQTQVTGLNDLGVTVGFWSTQNNANMVNNNFGFYSAGGRYHTVNFPTGNNASPQVDQLLGVNDRDVAVGFYTNAQGNNRGYTYNIRTRSFTRVLVPGAPAGEAGPSLTATAINNLGDVAGFYARSSSQTDTFLLLHSGRFITLAVPGASMTQAFGVNDRDEVVGAYTVGSGSNAATHGFTWRPGYGFRTVDDPHGQGATTINGVNDLGDLVGFYTDSAGNTDGMFALP